MTNKLVLGTEEHDRLGLDRCSRVAGSGSRCSTTAVTSEDPERRTPELSTSSPISLPRADKIVVLNFWASWCSPCRAEADDLQRAYAEFRTDGVDFVGINFRDDRSSALAFVRKFAISYDSIFDPDGEVAQLFSGIVINPQPGTILVDRRGYLAGSHLGAVTYDMLAAPLSELVAE